MLFNHDSGLIQSVLTIDTTVAPSLGGSNSLQIVGTGGLILPVGTTEQRPQTPVAGTQRFNSSTAQLEYYDGTKWVAGVDGTVTSVTVESDNAALTVTNGTVTDAGTITLSLDQTLVNLAASSPSASGGPVVRLANDTFVSRDLVAAAGSAVQITDGDGVAGNPTFGLSAPLENIADVTTKGFLFVNETTGSAETKTFAASGNITLNEAGGVLTFGYQASGDLAALTALGNGIVVKTGTNTYAAGTIGVSGTELSITGANTASPVITYTPSANVAAVNALTGAGYVTRQADGSLVTHSITGSTNTATGSIVVTDGGSVTGTSISFTPGVELAKVAALSATGVLVRDTTGAYTGHEIKGSGSISVSNGAGETAGDITISYDAGANLNGLAALSSTGYLVQTGSGTYAQRSFAVGAGVTAGHLTISEAAGQTGSTTFDFVAGTEVAGIAALATSGLVARTAAGAYTGRTLTSANSYITVADGDGIAANPTVTFVPGTNLAALSGTTVTGLLSRAADGALTGKTVTGEGSIQVNYTGDNIVVSYTAGANLGAINALTGSGIVSYNGTAFSTAKSIEGTAGNITVNNGDLQAGNAIVNLAAVTQASSGTFSKVTLDSFGRVVGNTAVTTTDITDLVDSTYVNVTGDTMSGNLAFGGAATVIGLTSPVNATDAATKGYVDSLVGGISWKVPVTSVGATNPATATTGDRFLNTTDGKIYTATATDTWGSPETPADGWATFDKATEAGYVYSGTTWVQFTGTGQIVAGVGLAKTGNVMDINLGAGIAQLPSDEVGVDIYNGSALFLTADGSAATTASDAKLALRTGTGLTQDSTSGVYIANGAIDNAKLANSTVTLTGNTGSDAFALGESVAITGAGSISTAVTDNALAISIANATTTTVGAASFAAADFTVTAGAVSIINKNLDTLANVTTTGKANGDLLSWNGTAWVPVAQSVVAPDLSLDAITDVVLTSAADKQLLQFNGTNWVNATIGSASGVQGFDTGLDSLAALSTAGFVTVDATGLYTSRTLVAGDGVSLSNTDGSGNLTIGNTGVLSVASADSRLSVSASTGAITLTNNAVASVTTSGAGVSVTGTNATGLVIANTGVTSNVAGAGISLSGGTGAVTIDNTGVLAVSAGTGIVIGGTQADRSITNDGVLTVTTTGNGLVAQTNSKGGVTITGNALTALTAGTGLSATTNSAGAVSIENTGVVTLAGTANQVDVGFSGTDYTVGLPASVTIDTALTVTGLGANKVLRTGAAGLVEGVALADGQFLIGATGAAPAAASITAGTGIQVTNSANGIAISLVGGAAAVNSVTASTTSTSAITVTNGGTAQAPTVSIAVDAGIDSLAALTGPGFVTVSADGQTFSARTLVAGTGVALSNTDGSGNLTIDNTGVTSVGLSLPSIFSVTGSPVTTTGTLSATLASQAAGTVFAAPAVGSGAPTFRALAYSDLPIVLYTEDTTAKTVDLTANKVAHASGNFAAAGDASAIEMVLRNSTSNATATELFVDGASVQAALPSNAAWNFTVQIVGRGTGVAGAYRFDGIIVKDSANSSTAFVGVPSKVILGETATALDAAVTADVTNGALKVTVTGDAAASMKWVATIRATQVIG